MGPSRSISFLKALVIVLLLVFAFPLYGYAFQMSESGHFVGGEVLAKFTPGATEAALNSIAGRMEGGVQPANMGKHVAITWAHVYS